MKATRATVYKFLKSQNQAVIATVSTMEQPMTTTVFYILTDDRKIQFATKSKTNKFENLKDNNQVALTVNHPSMPIAVNITGIARTIDDPQEMRKSLRKIGRINRHADDVQPIVKYDRGNFVVIEVIPSRIQYTDYYSEKDKFENVIVEV